MTARHCICKNAYEIQISSLSIVRIHRAFTVFNMPLFAAVGAWTLIPLPSATSLLILVASRHLDHVRVLRLLIVIVWHIRIVIAFLAILLIIIIIIKTITLPLIIIVIRVLILLSVVLMLPLP